MGGNKEGISSPICINPNAQVNGICSEVTYPCVIAMGNPLLDLIAEVPMDFIEKYKLKLNNAILAEADIHDNLYNELENNFQVDYLPGGAAQNSIRLCQAFIDIPNATGYIGCIAQDKYGNKMEEVMREEGIYNLYAYSEKSKETGTCAVLLNDKERSLCTRLCAANDYEIKFLKENKNTWECIQNANIFYSAGYFLTVCPEAMKTVGEYCVKTDKIFCTNLSAEFLIEYFKEPMMEVLEYADFVFSNDAEYLHFAKVHNLGTDSLPIIAEKVLNFPKKK